MQNIRIKVPAKKLYLSNQKVTQRTYFEIISLLLFF